MEKVCKYCDNPLSKATKKLGYCGACKNKLPVVKELVKLFEVIKKECNYGR